MTSEDRPADGVDKIRDALNNLGPGELERWLIGADEHLRDLMTDNEFAEESVIKRYLLGGLQGEARSRFEDRLGSEPELRARLAFVEDELCDDYALDALAADEREKVERYFLSTPERSLKLGRAALLKQSAGRPAERATDTSPSPVGRSKPWWHPFLSFINAPRLAAYAAIAAALLLASAAAWWLLKRSEHPSIPVVVKHPAVESSPGRDATPPASANEGEQTITSQPGVESPSPAPSSRPKTSPPQLRVPDRRTEPASPPVVFALGLGATRGAENNSAGARDTSLRPGVRRVIVKFYLEDMTAREYERFRLTVQASDGREVARQDGLKPVAHGVVEARFRAARFAPDDYRVTVSGMKNGSYNFVAEDMLKISK